MRPLLLVAALAGAARAQAIATAPDRPEVTRTVAEDETPDAVALRLVYGTSRIAGLADASLFEAGYEITRPHTPLNRFTYLGGTLGVEVWHAGPGSWGTSLPVQFLFGTRSETGHAAIGFGVHALLVDRIHGDTGVGVYAPLACASVGVQVGDWRLGAEAR